METIKCPIHRKELNLQTEMLEDGRAHEFAVCICDSSDTKWYGKVVSSKKIDPEEGQQKADLGAQQKSDKSKSKFTREDKEKES